MIRRLLNILEGECVIKGQDRIFDTEKRRKMKIHVTFYCGMYVRERLFSVAPRHLTNNLIKVSVPLKPTSNLNPSPKRLKAQGQIGPYLAPGWGAWVT